MNYFLSIILFFYTFASAQTTDVSLIEKARKFLYENETHRRPIYLDTSKHEIREASYEEASKRYVFHGEIKTPFTKTKFLRYFINTSSPTPAYIVVSYRDTFQLLVQWACNEGYGCKRLINFLNERLVDEKELNDHQVVELAEALLRISSPAWYFDRILTDYEEVSWIGDNNDTLYLPDRFKTLIKPMSIETDENSITLEYFLWNEVVLNRVTLLYKNHKININIQMVWNSGRKLSVG